MSAYFTSADFPTILARLKTLGARHIRDGILDSDPPYDRAIAQMLQASNAKLDGMTDCTGIQYYAQSPTSPIDIQKFNSAIGNGLESVEGPNEVDSRGDKTWVADTTACLPALKAAEPSLPFIAPSLGDPNDHAVQLGNISTYVTLGNEHRYFSGENPGNLGWGSSTFCGVYGAVSWAICEARINSGPVSVIVTETGYNSQTEVDEATQAKYLSRALLVNLQAGNPRTYIYDLKDYHGDGFGSDGLIRVDDSIKPAFNAIQRELAFFSDPGPTATKSPIVYSLSASTISNMLFERRDGSYILALWNETPSWNTALKQRIIVTPQKVSVTLPVVPIAPIGLSMNDSGALTSQPLLISGRVISLQVDDHVTLLTFKFLPR